MAETVNDTNKHKLRKSWVTIAEERTPNMTQGMSAEKLNRYQSKYDLLTSEQDYIATLQTTEKYVAKEKLKSWLTHEDYDLVFGQIKILRQISQDVLYDLNDDWLHNVCMEKMADIIQKHLQKISYYHLEYVTKYRTILNCMRRLIHENDRFCKSMQKISSTLFMSYENVLHMPIMRIRELCRLLQNVLERLQADEDREEYDKMLAVSRYYEKLAVKCDKDIVNSEQNQSSRESTSSIEVDNTQKQKDVPVVNISTRIARYAGKNNNSKVMWIEMPDVVEKRAVSKLSTAERQLQEAKFEIVTSQATYIKSLVTFELHYIKNIELAGVLLEDDLRTLFSTIKDVRRSAELFFHDLDEHFQKDVMLRGLFAILHNHLNQMHTFTELNKYARQYPRQKQCLDSLMQGEKFKELTDVLAKHPLSEGLKITSYFMVPIQRVTKLDLLVKTILKHMSETDKGYKQVQMIANSFEEVRALMAVSAGISQYFCFLLQLAERCNESVAYAENKEKTREVCNLMMFSKKLRPVILMATNRYFKKRTSVKEVDLKNNALSPSQLELFLFNDVLIMAKKQINILQRNAKYKIKDYSWMKKISAAPFSPLTLVGKPQLRQLCPVVLKFCSAKQSQDSELVISFTEEKDREPWLQDLNSASGQGPVALFRGNSFIS